MRSPYLRALGRNMGLTDILLGCPIKGRRGLSLRTVVFFSVIFMVIAGQTSTFPHLSLILREIISEIQ